MFSFFKKSPKKPAYDEKVWLEKAYKYQGLSRAVAEAINAGYKVLVLAHFEHTLVELGAMLGQSGTPFLSFTDKHHPDHFGDARLLLVQASVLRSPRVAALRQSLGTGLVECFIAEHFPLPHRDFDLLTDLAELAPATKPCFFVSLEDALLRPFASDNLKQLMERMGMPPDEVISHSLVARSIANAQEKIEETAKSTLMTYSPEEWMRVNLGT
jgi:hypothetical protein